MVSRVRHKRQASYDHISRPSDLSSASIPLLTPESLPPDKRKSYWSGVGVLPAKTDADANHNRRAHDEENSSPTCYGVKTVYGIPISNVIPKFSYSGCVVFVGLLVTLGCLASIAIKGFVFGHEISCPTVYFYLFIIARMALFHCFNEITPHTTIHTLHLLCHKHITLLFTSAQQIFALFFIRHLRFLINEHFEIPPSSDLSLYLRNCHLSFIPAPLPLRSLNFLQERNTTNSLNSTNNSNDGSGGHPASRPSSRRGDGDEGFASLWVRGRASLYDSVFYNTFSNQSRNNGASQ